MTAGWCARTVRAAVFAAVCVVLAALGHVMMSGDHVPLATLLAGWVLTSVVGWCLAGRERGLRLVVAVAVTVQTALHSAFSLAPAAGASGGPAPLRMGSMDMGADGMGSMGHDMGSMDPIPPAPMSMSGHMGHAGHAADGDSSLGMLAAHLLAALLCGLCLGHGERAVFRLLRALGGRLAAPLRLLLALPAPPPPPVRVRRWSSDRAPRLLLLVHAITSRGPPVRAAAV
ncbi:hypothetical protein [Streptomyces sp. DH10]|uniref:hypothetical protein n=1 Tax=Streptomyces sp. DH10 TaxID=3040121 RepID=UPI00244284E1|nr:hypothetical protein [Streptomyces sp. DH10]MDG9711105.1 hypothetical protein [Streptomyces sp. DH10]